MVFILGFLDNVNLDSHLSVTDRCGSQVDIIGYLGLRDCRASSRTRFFSAGGESRPGTEKKVLEPRWLRASALWLATRTNGCTSKAELDGPITIMNGKAT